ncbi:hypothetical protein L1987_35307 [Smallanthus sonchifolius]|uniref:Uncharacterized protein n=1 Tax=Smallanthus sonchifolius TaxID=185202 RepID=A0ACB9HWZ2_9ASTR|nr:hypothetical protein L1987_35307 [Smallanthus sonchifolius]
MDSRQLICLSPFSCIAILIFSLVIILITNNAYASYGENEPDYLALLQFKSTITRDPYETLTSWNSSLHFCNWSGVSCGKRHRRVIVLNMMSQGLTGSLSPLVGNLTFLRELWLTNNSFEGTIPHEVGRLSRLRFLYLDQNKFSGAIPTNLSGCSNLEELQLGSNKLVGSIPKDISFLSKLTLFVVDHNKLTGGIPHFLGNITSMKVFSISLNPFGGSIPDTLGRLKSLTKIYSSGCNISGTIPNSIYNNSLLTVLSMSDNQLNGSLPPAIGSLLPHLVFFQLKNNQLSGILPPAISNCSKLRYLEMDGNDFSGKLTIDFSKLRDINRVLLQHNLFGSGEADEMKFIDSLTSCSKLQYLGLGNCRFQGVVPKSIGNLSHQLQTLNLGSNQLYGNLPSSVGNLVGLKALSLVENQFTGKIPSTIGMLQNLQAAFLYENQFSGSIPDALGNLSKLVILSLRANKLEGDIPPILGNYHQLQKLELSNNKLSGKIPKQILQLPSLSVLLNLSRNNLFGSLPMEVGDLKMLSNLDLSHNNLSGNIPGSLGGCVSLSFLSLKGNLFQGMIPPSFSSLRGVMKLDLSHNNLSGQIPRFLERFSLQYIDLSFNDFEGEAPLLGVFANASAFSILGNSRLCGGLLELGLPKCNKTKKHGKMRIPFIIVILIASTHFILLCLVYVWCKKKCKTHPSQSSMNEQLFMKVSYNQLLKATDGFSEANLIGKGGFSYVYKGILNFCDDRFVAVKVLHLHNRGAHKSFKAECEAWRRIRHRNLLKIITSCSSIDFQGNDFKALVYEFMPNGSLHDWLHSSSSTMRLNLLQRLNILIDVASALDYLHNQCSTTIIHGDLKPSNILLDKNMIAHVGDFGLTRFFGTYLDQNNSSGTTGTIGYAPPVAEYGLGSVMTSSGDVYSFGILLLEVMTGKKPTDDVFTEGLTLHKFASMALRDRVSNFIDGDAIDMQNTGTNVYEECLASIVKIGVSCSMDSPLLRMNIKIVVHKLQHILDVLQNV